MLKQFFSISDGYWIHTRVEKELALAMQNKAKMHERASKAAQARWDKQENNATSNAQAMLKECPSPSPSPLPLTTTNKNIPPPEGVDVSLWNDYLKVRKAAKKPLTDTALKGLIREAEKAKITLSDALQTCCERSWVGFKAEWIEKPITTQDRPNQKWDATLAGIMAKGKELGIEARPGETEGQYRERVRSGRA